MPNTLAIGVPGFVTIRQAAAILGTTVDYVRRLYYGGYLDAQAVKIGGKTGHVLLDEASVHRYADEHPNLGERRVEATAKRQEA